MKSQLKLTYLIFSRPFSMYALRSRQASLAIDPVSPESLAFPPGARQNGKSNYPRRRSSRKRVYVRTNDRREREKERLFLGPSQGRDNNKMPSAATTLYTRTYTQMVIVHSFFLGFPRNCRYTYISHHEIEETGRLCEEEGSLKTCTVLDSGFSHRVDSSAPQK